MVVSRWRPIVDVDVILAGVGTSVNGFGTGAILAGPAAELCADEAEGIVQHPE